MAGDLDPFKQEELKKRLESSNQQRAERLRERRKRDIQEVVKTPHGRRLYWAHLEAAGYFAETFVEGAPDVSARNQGERKVGIKIFGDLMWAAPEAFFQMYRENASEIAGFKAEDEKLIQEAKSNG